MIATSYFFSSGAGTTQEGLDGISSLQRQFSDHIASVNSQLKVDILRLQDPESTELASI